LAILQIDEHLMLRPYQSTDADLLFAAIDRERKHLGPWLGWVAHTTRPKHSLDFIELCQRQILDQQALPLGIFFKGEIVGGIGMHDWIQDTKCAQVGYWIAKEHEGKGIVARSVTALLDYLFVVVGINKAEIRFVVANNRSAALAHRLGFKTEGILRQSFTRNGMIEDLVVTGMLKSEWVQREQ
jgi:ribosomal-protein-serine acetyltransferase